MAPFSAPRAHAFHHRFELVAAAAAAVDGGGVAQLYLSPRYEWLRPVQGRRVSDGVLGERCVREQQSGRRCICAEGVPLRISACARVSNIIGA